jgi:hypothetical protein
LSNPQNIQRQAAFKDRNHYFGIRSTRDYASSGHLKLEPPALICLQQAEEGHPFVVVSKCDLFFCDKTMHFQDTDITIQDKLGSMHAYKHCWLVETISQRLRQPYNFLSIIFSHTSTSEVVSPSSRDQYLITIISLATTGCLNLPHHAQTDNPPAGPRPDPLYGGQHSNILHLRPGRRLRHQIQARLCGSLAVRPASSAFQIHQRSTAVDGSSAHRDMPYLPSPLLPAT